ncbi:hypothetical protein [Cohnella cellulosilytica]|uniref:Uncharacterized protein n=1 Tax=Cohnella cellulosilytica TaxID=986710 RepID=A0ABW2FBC4_9BACL
MANTVNPLQTYPRLTVYTDENYRGRSAIYRGNLGIVDLDRRLGGIESLRFFSTSANATLVLFTRPNFRGTFRVFRGNTNIRDLDDIIGDNDAESLISTNQRLTLAQIRAIRDSGNLPQGYRRL